MAVISGNTIFARARTLATQTGQDANSAITIDNLGGLRAMLNHTIRDVYRKKSTNTMFMRDIVTKNTIAVVDGVGACPDTIMREFLKNAQIQDVNGSLVTYYDYNIDQSSGVNYGQLAYCVLSGDNLLYTEPDPGDSTSYNDDLYVMVASFPTFPASMADDITFPSETVIDDIVIALAAAIIGKN